MAEQVGAGLRFHDLGPLMLELAGTNEPVRGGRITSALALLLIRANQRVSADALVDAMWGDEPTAAAYSTLDSHLYRLRRVLEPGRQRGKSSTTLVHDTSGYRLVVTSEQVDSLLFEELAGGVRDLLVSYQPQRALARCDQALHLWRGEPWTPHTDAIWATAAVGRLHEIRARVLEQRLQTLLLLGDPDTVLADLGPLLELDPLRERLWAMAMLAAYRTGRVDQALETFTRARRTLIEEAGIEPGRELTDLQAKILSRDPDLDGSTPQEPAGASVVEVHLPHRRTELLGRSRELAHLTEGLTRERLLTVVGPAGCGKTRLAIEVARHAVEHFPDGVWFIDLTVAADHGQLLDTVTSTLGLAAPEVGSVADALRAFTRTRQMLLVLDNCEHVLDAVVDLVDALLGQHSEATFLTTSREPLALDVESVWPLAPLPVPPTADEGSSEVSGDDLRGVAAVELFVQRATAASPDLHIGSVELAQVSEICRAVDGLPLAIELAAGQTRSFSLSEIAERVRHDPASLARVGRNGSRHHATLRGAIELSVNTLDDAASTVHQAVATVPGPFTTDLAAHVAGLDVPQAASALGNLVHRSLLTPLGAQRSSQASRFSQLATVRAQGLASFDSTQRGLSEQRRDAWVARLVTDMPNPGQVGETAWHARVDDDLAAVRATLQHCLVERPDPLGTRVATRLGMYWFYRGMVIEWERWIALASTSTVADPFDRLLARGSLVGVSRLASRGHLGREWMDAVDAFTQPLSHEQQIALTHYLLTTIMVSGFSDTPDVSVRALSRMRHVAEATSDGTASLLATVGALLTSLQTDQAADPAAIDDLYTQVQAAQNHFAAWAVAQAGTLTSLVRDDPATGLRWSNVLLDQLARIGAEVNIPAALEMRGDLLAMNGQAYEAVRTLARSRSSIRRAGLAWPMLPATASILAAAESRLSPADAELAYREGVLDPAPIPRT